MAEKPNTLTNAAKAFIDTRAERQWKANVYRTTTILFLLVAAIFAGAWVKASEPVIYIIRIHPDGRPESTIYRRNATDLDKPEIRFFLREFVTKHYQRIPNLTPTTFADSTQFLSDELDRHVRMQEQTQHEVQDFITGKSGDEATEIQIDLIDLKKTDTFPMEADVHFSKAFKSRTTGLPAKPAQKMLAQIHFLIDPARVNDAVNPLGFSITNLTLQSYER